MKSVFTFVLIIAYTLIGSLSLNAQDTTALALSQDMLLSFKMNQPIEEYEQKLARLPLEQIAEELNSDQKKKAFWTNIYITYSQKLIGSEEGAECDKKCKKAKVITVGNRVFSLNDILYKILLGSKSTMTNGKRLFPSKWEKMLRVSYPDGRILFAIHADKDISDVVSYFEPDKMDKQLNEVSMIFLKKYVYYDVDKNLVYLPKWIKHFRREFGKNLGIYGGLRRAGIITEAAQPEIIYSDKIAEFK